MESRIASTRVLGAAIRSCREPPPVWLNSSTATIYKHSFDRAMDETSGVIGATPEAKDEFSVEVATSWEREFDNALTPQTRKVSMRTAIVFGAGPGSAFQILRRLSRLGLGGRQGTGRQFVSWIHEHDFASAVEWLISHEDLTGPVNLAAPNPLPNQEVMRILRKTCGAPIGLPAPEWLLEIGASFLRTETELVIKSRRVVPGKLLAAGFPFRITEFEAAVQELVTRGR